MRNRTHFVSIVFLALLIMHVGFLPRRASAASATPTSCGTVTGNLVLSADLVTSNATCLTAGASGITIDGNGHRITAAQYAVQITNQNHVTVNNVVSSQAVQIYGAGAHHDVIANSKIGLVAVYIGDDNVIRDSMLQKLVISGLYNDPAQREVITGNVISSTLTKSEEKLVEVVTGTDGTFDADGTVHCAAGEHVIKDNFLLGIVVSTVSTTEPELLYVRCGALSTISGNTIRSGQRAAGILLRDGADDNLIEDNDVWIGDGNEGALLIQSGSVGYHHPRDNMFQGNSFRASQGRSFWLQAGATRGNTFAKNLFRSDGGAETVRLTDGPGVTTFFDHNTFYRGGTGTLVVFRNLGMGANQFASNIFTYVGGPSGIFALDKPVAWSGYRGDYNVFFNPNGTVIFTQYGGVLAGWQYVTGQDAHSIETNPGFVDPAAGNFQLKSTSGVLGKGAAGSNPGGFPVAP